MEASTASMVWLGVNLPLQIDVSDHFNRVITVGILHEHYMPSDAGMGRQMWGPRHQMAYLRVGCVCWHAGPPLAHCSSIKSR